MRAADLDGEAGAQLFQCVGARGDFVIRRYPGRQIGHEAGPGQAAGMPLDDLAERIRRFENPHHPRLRFQHRAHVHDFGKTRDLRPGHQFADFLCLEVCT